MVRLVLALLLCAGSWKETNSVITMVTDGTWTRNLTFPFGVDIRGTDHLYFWLKCSNDAFLHLMPSEDPSNEANIQMGVLSNAKCQLRPCGGCSQSHSPNFAYLSRTQSRPFWISWTGNIVKLGQGQIVDEFTIVTATVAMPFEAKYLAASSGWNAIGEWKFQEAYHFNRFPCTPKNFQLHNFNAKITTTPFMSIVTATYLECVQECRVIRGCQSANYHSPSQACDIFNTLTYELGPANPDWKIWNLT